MIFIETGRDSIHVEPVVRAMECFAPLGVILRLQIQPGPAA